MIFYYSSLIFNNFSYKKMHFWDSIHFQYSYKWTVALSKIQFWNRKIANAFYTRNLNTSNNKIWHIWTLSWLQYIFTHEVSKSTHFTLLRASQQVLLEIVPSNNWKAHAEFMLYKLIINKIYFFVQPLWQTILICQVLMLAV